MPELDINAEIAERIMGWIVDRQKRQYYDLDALEAWDWIPDFRFVETDYEMFLRRMKSLGYVLTQDQAPLDERKTTEPYFTACFSGHGQHFPVAH